MPADGGELYKRRHADQRSMADADQAEFLALKSGAALVDEGVYDDLVAGAMDDFEHLPDEAIHEEWHGRDLAEDGGTGKIQELVEQRVALLGELYPFRLEGNRLVYVTGSSGMYEFLLAASVRRDISSKPFNRIPQVFERAISVISEGLLGPGAKSLHVGSPRDEVVGKSFKAAFEKLHELTGEWPWRPLEYLPPEGPPGGDDGLDFVAWLSSNDNRPGRLFLIGQCACGDDWVDKLDELTLERIGAWTGHGWQVKPIKIFATPHVLAGGHFVRDQQRAGLIQDRVRLCRLEDARRDTNVLAPFKDEMLELTKLVLRA